MYTCNVLMSTTAFLFQADMLERCYETNLVMMLLLCTIMQQSLRLAQPKSLQTIQSSQPLLHQLLLSNHLLASLVKDYSRPT